MRNREKLNSKARFDFNSRIMNDWILFAEMPISESTRSGSPISEEQVHDQRVKHPVLERWERERERIFIPARATGAGGGLSEGWRPTRRRRQKSVKKVLTGAVSRAARTVLL